MGIKRKNKSNEEFLNSYEYCIKACFHISTFQIQLDRYSDDDVKHKYLSFFEERLSELFMVDLFPATFTSIPDFVNLNDYQFNKIIEYFEVLVKSHQNDHNFDKMRKIVNSFVVIRRNICVLYTCLVNAKQAVAKRLNDKAKNELSSYRSKIVEDPEIKDILKKYESLSNLKDKLEYITELKIYYNIIIENKEKLELVAKLDYDLQTRIDKLASSSTNQQDSVATEKLTSEFDLKWNTKTPKKSDGYSINDFLELCKGLILSNAIIGNQKDFVKGFAQLLNLKIKNLDQQFQSMLKSRNIESQTKFLDTLKKAVNQLANEKAQKN